MSIEKLTMSLSRYGNIEVIKEGLVFVLFLRGSGLSNWKTVNKIMDLILKAVGEKYPDIEVMKNTESFFLLVLKPKYA